MNGLAFFLAILVACNVIDHTIGFQMGSRGLSELDMTRTQLDVDADLYFKTVSAHPYVTNHPNNLKQDKYNYNGQNNVQDLDLIDQQKLDLMKNQRDYLFVSVITGCTVAVLLALLAGGVCIYTLKRSKYTGFETKAPLFNAGNTGISKSGSIKSNSSNSSGDRRLAQSAQMFHYQHQKQQMLAMEIANKADKPDPAESSEGENDDADFTVYECPGLAPTGEMEVKNPLFKEDFASSPNIHASCQSLASMPPAYSTVSAGKPEVTSSSSAAEQTNLVQINETAVEKKVSATPSEKNEEK